MQSDLLVFIVYWVAWGGGVAKCTEYSILAPRALLPVKER